ncbi:MAG: DISARM system SNF2-like helicase DrmD [Vicinamibacterales bacterium]
MTTVETAAQGVPRAGMLATVRNRRGIVTAVEPYNGPEGRLHLVTVEYSDTDGVAEDQLVWEREVGASLQEPSALPNVTDEPPMPPEDYEAFVRASRWSAVTPFIDPDGSDGPLTRLPLVAPLHGAIQVEDFQLVPLLKALRMPRVSLLLADDVGLGKTVEAGLILSELMLRRRTRRILILCPASLRGQWRQEMQDKFALLFDEVDRAATESLRRQLGLDANPWRTHERVVTSYDYLKQPDVLEQFRSASVPTPGSPHLPWDLLIVDEAHNLAPAPFGEESEASQLLGQLAPMFEHKLFLTATPHNGHTRSFSGLLERLDPVRFSRQTEALSAAERARVEEVVVRRLKREINERTRPHTRFSDRKLRALTLYSHREELALANAFQAFRLRVRELVAARRRTEQLAGAFAVEVLGKRLLSCPATFADSWRRYRAGLDNVEAAADAADVRAAERAVREDTADDREWESRTAHAAITVGAWLQPLAGDLREEIGAVDRALEGLRLIGPQTAANPLVDARFEALRQWIDDHLRVDSRWRDDERVVIFTEYKTTLDYLARRLTDLYPEAGRILTLFGSMDPPSLRDDIKQAFNDPSNAVRVLVATDAASEGLNLQETARYLLHYDVPWNPSRLEQRNGRLDRHGQARDVFVFHFASDDEADLRFLAHVVQKVDAIREDLGSVGDVFDAAFKRRFIQAGDEPDVRATLDQALEGSRRPDDLQCDRTTGLEAEAQDGVPALAQLAALAEELDFTPDTLRTTLDVALRVRSSVGPGMEGPDADGRYRLRASLPAEWQAIVDETVRLAEPGGRLGPLPAVVFDPRFFIDARSGRPVFRPRRDTALLHLGHPLFQRALLSFARARFSGRHEGASRWVVRRGPVPDGAEALLLVTVEELAVNRLRESFHHWVRTIQVPVRDGGVGTPLTHVPASALSTGVRPAASADVTRARTLWSDVMPDLRGLLSTLAAELEHRLTATLEEERVAEVAREDARYRSRQGEVSALMEQQSMARLEREIAELELARQQGRLFDDQEALATIVASQREKEEELARRRQHYEGLRTQLARERTRVLEYLVPQRYALRGEPQVFPLAVEVRFPVEERA